jgi:opacity protein-like surface antigen
MKRLFSLAVCTALAALIGTAQAQSQNTNFTGPAVGVSLSAARNKVEYGSFLAGSESKKSDAVSRLDASYGFGLSPQWVLSVGETYDLNKTDFGRVSYVSGGTQTVDVKLKNHAAIYVAPGYQVAPNWLAYGKLSWHHAKGEYNDTGTGSGTTNHTGTGVGFGLATAFSKNIEGRFEVEQVNYSREARDRSTGKPKTSQATLYVGYRF